MKFVAYFSYYYSCKHAVLLDFLLLRESLISFILVLWLSSIRYFLPQDKGSFLRDPFWIAFCRVGLLHFRMFASRIGTL